MESVCIALNNQMNFKNRNTEFRASGTEPELCMKYSAGIPTKDDTEFLKRFFEKIVKPYKKR